MSDNLLDTDQFGKASVEASQNFVSMPDPAKAAEADADQARFNTAAERMAQPAEPGEGVNEPYEITYNKMNSDGTRSDERYPANATVTAERAARDIAQHRKGLDEINKMLADQALADQLRGAEAAQPEALPQQAEQPVQQEPQPELPPVPPGLENDELVKAFQREPRILEAVRAMEFQSDQKVAAVQQQAVQYAQDLMGVYAGELRANASAAIATVFSQYPELQGLSQAELPAAIQVISKQDPNRALQLKNHIQNVQMLSAKAQQMEAAQAQQIQARQRQQFESWAKQADDAWEAEFTRSEPPQRQQQIRSQAHQMFREAGLTDQQIAHEWQTNSLLRSRQGQSFVADAARWRLHQKTLQSVRPGPTPAPKVVRPGSSSEKIEARDFDLHNLSQKLNSSHSARDAAALLAARRAKSR